MKKFLVTCSLFASAFLSGFAQDGVIITPIGGGTSGTGGTNVYNYYGTNVVNTNVITVVQNIGAGWAGPYLFNTADGSYTNGQGAVIDNSGVHDTLNTWFTNLTRSVVSHHWIQTRTATFFSSDYSGLPTNTVYADDIFAVSYYSTNILGTAARSSTNTFLYNEVASLSNATLVADGDSIINGYNAGGLSWYYDLVHSYLSGYSFQTNVSVSGTTAFAAVNRFTNNVLPYAGTNTWLFFAAGVNDIYFGSNTVQTINNISNEWALATAHGFHIVAATITDRADFSPRFSSEKIRAEVNNWIRNNPSRYDYLIDIDRLLPIANTNYQTDGVHPSVATHALIAREAFWSLIRPNLSTLMSDSFKTNIEVAGSVTAWRSLTIGTNSDSVSNSVEQAYLGNRIIVHDQGGDGYYPGIVFSQPSRNYAMFIDHDGNLAVANYRPNFLEGFWWDINTVAHGTFAGNGGQLTNIPASSVTGSATNGNVIVSTKSDGGLLATNFVTGDYRDVNETMDVNTTGSFTTSKSVTSATNHSDYYTSKNPSVSQDMIFWDENPTDYILHISPGSGIIGADNWEIDANFIGTTNFTAHGTVKLPGVTTGMPADSTFLTLDSSGNVVKATPSGGGSSTYLETVFTFNYSTTISGAGVLLAPGQSAGSVGNPGQYTLVPPGTYTNFTVSCGGPFIPTGTNFVYILVYNATNNLYNSSALTATISGQVVNKVLQTQTDSTHSLVLTNWSWVGVLASNTANTTVSSVVGSCALQRILQ